jgi:hypothetical protein
VITAPLEHDLDAEERIVGFMLLDGHCKALRRLRPRYDLTADRAEIYEAIEQSRAAGVPSVVSYVMQYLHPDMLPRLQSLRDAAICSEVGVLVMADDVDRLERCRHRRVVRYLRQALTQVEHAPPREFDCAFAALLDAGLRELLRLLVHNSDGITLRPTCVLHTAVSATTRPVR